VCIHRAAAGIHDLAAKILTVESIPEFHKFVPHLRLIAGSKVRVASLGQNAQSAHDDDTAREIAELYVGCLAAHVGTDIELDPSQNGRPTSKMSAAVTVAADTRATPGDDRKDRRRSA
jgi:hypothetical protein